MNKPPETAVARAGREHKVKSWLKIQKVIILRLNLKYINMDKLQGKSHLKRPVYPMPDFIREALKDSGLMETYEARPPYQRNDYIGWITRAKRPETQRKRLDEMLGDLRAGDRYMKMPYKPSFH